MQKVPIRIARCGVALGVVACLSGISALAQNARPAQSQTAKPVLLEDLDKPAGPVTIGDPKVMPNVVGIALHMGVDEAMAALRRAYPKAMVQSNTVDMPTVSKPTTYVMWLPNSSERIGVELTFPPEKQVVWKIGRGAIDQHVNRGTLLAALREKYGKETVGFVSTDEASATTDDARMQHLYWLFDEQGRRAPAPRSLSDLLACATRTPEPTTPNFLLWEVYDQPPSITNTWVASSCVMVMAMLDNGSPAQPIVESVHIEAINIPLALRTAKASNSWWKAAAERLRREEIEKTKTAKPRL